MTSALTLFASIGIIIILCFVLSALSGMKFWTLFTQVATGLPSWISTLLTWPVVTLLFIIIFRHQIVSILNQFAKFIAKMKSAKVLGNEFDTISQTEIKGDSPDKFLERAVNQTPAAENTVVAQAPVAAAGRGANPTVSEGTLMELLAQSNTTIEELRHVANNFKTFFLANAAGFTTEKQIDSLLILTAASSIQLGHERQYRLLFGTQIHFLKGLREFGPKTFDEAQKIYAAAKVQFPEIYNNYQFEGWLGYLKDSGLCLQDDQGRISISIFGLGLLKYMFDHNLTAEKYA